MEIKIIDRTEDQIIIEWSLFEGAEFGVVTIKSNGKGGFIIDSEYISIETLIKIIKMI